MNHGTHCYCVVCKVGKSLGLMEVCTSKVCVKCNPASVKKSASKKRVLKVAKKTVKRGKKK